jgi:hypothetical protein
MALQTFPSLSAKGKLMKALSASLRFNSRNMENPWYGLWAIELQKLVEPFNNLIIVPQYTLWFSMSDDEPENEPIEEVDEDALSEIDQDEEEDEEGTHGLDDSDDEMDLFRYKNESDEELNILRDKDESVEPIEGQNLNPAPQNTEHDPDTSITNSLFTVADGSAPQLTPDFVALHILAKKLSFPTNAGLRCRYERRAGYRIIHKCCPLVVEIKSFPSRNARPARFKYELNSESRIAEAKVDMGYQCYYLFKKYPCSLRTIAVIASGDYWTHLIVRRSDVPRGAGDEMDMETWDALAFPRPVLLGTSASDLRLGEVSNYLRVHKPDLPLN